MGKKLAKVEKSAKSVVSKLEKTATHLPGDIVLNVTGKDAGSIVLSSGQKATTVTTQPVSDTPLVEVTAEPDKLIEVLDGKKDARKAFVEGGIRVRGNIVYLENLLKELGLMN